MQSAKQQKRAQKATTSKPAHPLATKQRLPRRAANIRKISTATKSNRPNTTTQLLPNGSADAPNTTTVAMQAPQKSSKRSMAFSFDKRTTLTMVNKPVQQNRLPWEKHNIAAEETMVNTLFKSQRDLEDKYHAHMAAQDPSYQAPSTPTQPEPEQSNTSRPMSSFSTSKFSFSKVTHKSIQQAKKQFAGEDFAADQSESESDNQPNQTLIPQSRFGGAITSVMQPVLDKEKAHDLSGVGLTDFDTLFAHSTMKGAFAQQHAGPTFWSKFTSETNQLYFAGTRQTTFHGPDGAPLDPVYCFKKLTVNKQMRTIREDFTTYDFQLGRALTTNFTINLEPDLTRGAIQDTNFGPNGAQVKCVARYRGVGWKWHSQVLMTHISHKDPVWGQKPPDVFNVSRFKFTLDQLICEKVAREENRLATTIVDDMKLVPKEVYDKRLAAAMNEGGVH